MAVDLKSPKAIAIIIALVVVVLGAGVGVGYLIMKPQLDEAEEQVADTEDDSGEASQGMPAEDATGTVETEVIEEVESSGPEEPEEEEEAAAVEPDGRYPGIIKSIDPVSSGWEIVIDYVQVLTGADADAAAAAHGDETPVPNDYYVVNDNPKLRTIAISATCAVLMHDTPAADPSDGVIMGDVTITFDDFRVNRWGALPYYEGAIYWIDISDGEITNIEHFWVP